MHFYLYPNPGEVLTGVSPAQVQNLTQVEMQKLT